MKYDFDEIIDRKGTNSIKWECMTYNIEGSDEDTLPLWIADMDFACAQPIIDALHERVDRMIFGYSTFNSENYYKAVTGWFAKRFKWKVEHEDIFFSPGVVPALGALIRILTKEGEGVIIQRPVYYPFTNMIENNNRVIVNNTLINKNGKYFIDFDDLEEKAKKQSNRMMILCSPHNPVGRVWTEEELKKIGEICIKNDVFLISDEIHSDLIRKEKKHVPIAKIFNNENIITCTSPSKTFNLAGLQMSNIIITNDEIKDKWNKEVYDKLGLMGANPFGIVATQTAYEEGEEWLEQVLDYIDENLKFVDTYLKENMPKAKYIIPDGTYLAWIDLRGYDHNYKELKELMVKNAKLALDDGYIFGKEGEGFERINVACPRSILISCLDKMKSVLEK